MVYPRGGVPPTIEEHLRLDSSGNHYKPVLFFNDFWLMPDDMIPVNETVPSLTLSLAYSPISLMKWQMMIQMEQSFAMQQSMGTSREGESDEFKVTVEFDI